MKKVIITLEATKEGLDIYLRLRLDRKIENFLSSLCPDVDRSTRWVDKQNRGLEFYRRSSSQEYSIQNFLNDNNCFDDIGQPLFQNGRINFAVLRIKDASKGITFKVSGLISYDELKTYIETIGKLTKNFYSNYIIRQRIKAVITYEI